MLLYFSPIILFIYSLHVSLVRSVVCNKELYGSPKATDCDQVLLKIPFAGHFGTSDDSRQSHLFVEPQFLRPPFSEVLNRFRPEPIIQVPKIWKHGELGSRISRRVPPI